MVQTNAPVAFPTLQGHKYANLTTYRKNGAAVVTPVWFAEEDGKVYVMTLESAGKTKRIRNNPRVQLAPCTARGKPLGPPVDAVARILTSAEEAVAKQALDRKYGLVKKVFDLITGLRKPQQRVYFEIKPA